MNLSRRTFLKNICFSTVLAPAIAAASSNDLHVQKSEVSIAYKTLPAALDGFRIGFLSDAHVSTCNGEDLLGEAVELLLQEKLDTMLFGGDYVLVMDSWMTELSYRSKFGNDCHTTAGNYTEMQNRAAICFEKAARLLAKIKDSCPCYAVLGNHDRWNSADLCQEIFSRYGLQVLVNEQVSITRKSATLRIFGADDYWTGVPRMPEAAKDPDLEFTILLEHNPDFISELQEIDGPQLFDLALCGHTHGGQVHFPLLGAPICNIQDRALMQGLFQSKDFACYTSRGVGTSGFPWRYHCSPEVAVITLRSSLT